MFDLRSYNMRHLFGGVLDGVGVFGGREHLFELWDGIVGGDARALLAAEELLYVEA